MDGPPASDRSLLDRLNALKPTSINLADNPSSNSISISTIERAKSPSREDALTARLKSLRNQASRSTDTTTSERQHQPVGEATHPGSAGSPGLPTGSKSETQQVTATDQVTDDVDPLLYTDDQTLEDLLADLRSDDDWLDEVAAKEEEHQRVNSLLAELSKSPSVRDMPDHQGAAEADSENTSDDDSEGEVMTNEVDSVLAKAKDEVDWENANKGPSASPPSVPVDAKEASPRDNVSSANENPFNLPTVPSDLQDQPDLPTSSPVSQSDTDFAASIASRMAALKLSGPRALPTAPTAAVDSLGLPQAPTFAPADHPVPGLVKRAGLTDDDQKTWCVVCLDDGTIRCLGCEDDDNVYCARYWKEMHVGPQAGYDERGHSWETFRSRTR